MTKIFQTTTQKEFNPIYAVDSYGTSDKYQHADSNILRQFIENKNFRLVGTSFGTPRKKERIGYQKHVMVFEHDSFMIDDTNRLQLLVTNSHDGTSSLILNLGVFRTVCANGLVVGEEFQEFRIPHRGKLLSKKIKIALTEIIANAERYTTVVRRWQSTMLTQEEIGRLAKSCFSLRVKESLQSNNETLIGCTPIAKSNRPQDNRTDLWTVFNKIQENIIRGRIRYQVARENEKGEIVTSIKKLRAIRAVSKLIDLNKKLWNEAVIYERAA